MKPLVSVIIPVYNKEPYLKECLDSILIQLYKNIEVICIDDGSTDNSLQILKEYQLTHNNIYVFAINHRGVSFARNYGIKKASGIYVHFVDADDVLLAGTYDKLFSDISDKQIDLITFFLHRFKNGENVPLCIDHSSDFADFFNNKNCVISTYIDNPDFYIDKSAGGSNIGCKLFRLQTIVNNKIYFDTKISFGEDADFYFRYLYYCNNILSFPYMLYCYRTLDEKGFSYHLLNSPKTFNNDLAIFVNSIKLYKNKSKNACYSFVTGCMTIIFNAYNYISANDAKRIATIELDKFIKKYNSIFESMNLYHIFESYFKLFEENKRKYNIYKINYYQLFKQRIKRIIYKFIQKKPLVSVIVPIYNRDLYLDDCLNSLFKQSYKKIEVICVNDGSTDNSDKIISKYCLMDHRFKCYEQINQGSSVSRNIGTSKSSGDYICFVDSDDMLKKQTIKKLVKFATKHKVDAVRYCAEIIGDSNHIFAEDRYLLKHKYPKVLKCAKYLNDFICNGDFTSSVCMHFLKASIAKKIKFIPNIVHEDIYYSFCALLISDKIYVEKKPLYIRRVSPKSIMSSKFTIFNSYSCYYTYKEILSFINLNNINISSSVLNNFIENIKVLYINSAIEAPNDRRINKSNSKYLTDYMSFLKQHE